MPKRGRLAQEFETKIFGWIPLERRKGLDIWRQWSKLADQKIVESQIEATT